MQVRFEFALDLPDEAAGSTTTIQGLITQLVSFLGNDCGLEKRHIAALLESVADGLRGDQADEFPEDILEEEPDGEERTYRTGLDAQSEIQALSEYKNLEELERRYQRASRLEKSVEMLVLAAEMLSLVPAYYRAANAVAEKHGVQLQIRFGSNFFLRGEEDYSDDQVFVSDPFGYDPWKIFAKCGYADGVRAKAAAVRLVRDVEDEEVFEQAFEEDLYDAVIYEEIYPLIAEADEFTSKELASRNFRDTNEVSGKLKVLATLGIIRKVSSGAALARYEPVQGAMQEVEAARAKAGELLSELLLQDDD